MFSDDWSLRLNYLAATMATTPIGGMRERRASSRGYHITRPTAVLIDRSGAMRDARPLGRGILRLITPHCRSMPMVYSFDTIVPYVSAAQQVGARVERDGNGAIGTVVQCMRIRRQRVEQFLLITDEAEDAAPTFVEALTSYAEALKVRPTVCIVRHAGTRSRLVDRCKAANFDVKTFIFTGDWSTLPAVLPMLASSG